MNVSVFDFKDYKIYLNRWIEGLPGGGRGVRMGLAKAAGCQTAYISQILNGSADFSLEQADLLNTFLGHGKDEGSYFLLLIQYGRAGSASLKRFFLEQIQAVLEKRMHLREKVKFERTFSMEEQPLYFSAWYYAAVHVCLTIPSLQSKEAIARHLNLSVGRVAEVLQFLSDLGLAKQEKNGWKTGPARIHLEHDSPLISSHHINWRMQAIQSLEQGPNKDLHYSSVVTIAREDAIKIKDELTEALARAKKIIKDSKEDSLHCLSLDFFEINHS